jgi:hypothetical protein
MALRRNLEGLASLFPPSQRPYKPWLEETEHDISSILPLLTGRAPAQPSSVGIDLPSMLGQMSTSRPPTRTRISAKPSGSFFSNLPTSPPGSIFDLLGGGTAEQTTGGDQIFGPSGGTVPPPPSPPNMGGPGPETAPVDQGSTISPLPDQSQPASKAQRIQQLKAQVSALENQIRQIMRQIQELQGEGGRTWHGISVPEAPPGIGMNPPPTPPTPPTPWKPPLGG